MSETTKDDRPRGQFFSRIYLERVENLADSPRFRKRLMAHFDECVPDFSTRADVAALIKRELGVEVPNFGSGPAFYQFFDKAEIRDVLDTLTIVYLGLVGMGLRNKASKWVVDVASIFSEEGLLYSIDDKGGVHRAVDAEFDRNRESAIRALGSSRFRATHDALERAFTKFSQRDRDSKGAVRDCFEAAETLVKLLTDKDATLTERFVRDQLGPIVDRIYSGDRVTASTAGRMVSSFADWVQAAHPFRHGQKTETPTKFPDDLAVLLVSQGASFIRWLADTDQQARK